MKRFAKVLSLCLATVIAFSVFTVNSYAMSAAGEAHRRQLTDEEIRSIRTIFEPKHYANMYPDVKNELGDDPEVLFNHFITFGIWEQRQPSAWFNVDAYASRNYDLHKLYGDDIVAYYMHYIYNRGDVRPIPTREWALRQGATLYSVYDFEVGSLLPKKGAIPIQTPDYHPGVEIYD